jgi:large subunit ribosomal protein L29
MSLSKIKDARNLTDEELATQILAVKRQLFDLRLRQSTRQLEKTHEFGHARHRLAQLMTVEGERKTASLAAEKASSTKTVATQTKPETSADPEAATNEE